MDKFDEMVEELELNEDLVECKECFDLFPKADCVKDKLGYICPACHRAVRRGEDSRINSRTITTDLFDQDFPEVDDYDPDTVTDYADDPKLADAFDYLIDDEVEAIDGYDKVSEVVQDSELDPEDKDAALEVLDHIKDEEEEHIDELKDVHPEGVEDDDLDELFDIKLDAKGFGGTGNNVHVGPGSMPLVSSLEEVEEGEELTEACTWTCVFDGTEVGTVEAASEAEALEKMQVEYPEYPYGDYDGCFEVRKALQEGPGRFIKNLAKNVADGVRRVKDKDSGKIIDTFFENGYVLWCVAPNGVEVPDEDQSTADTVAAALEAAKALSKNHPKVTVFVFANKIDTSELSQAARRLAQPYKGNDEGHIFIASLKGGNFVKDESKAIADKLFEVRRNDAKLAKLLEPALGKKDKTKEPDPEPTPDPDPEPTPEPEPAPEPKEEKPAEEEPAPTEDPVEEPTEDTEEPAPDPDADPVLNIDMDAVDIPEPAPAEEPTGDKETPAEDSAEDATPAEDKATISKRAAKRKRQERNRKIRAALKSAGIADSELAKLTNDTMAQLRKAILGESLLHVLNESLAESFEVKPGRGKTGKLFDTLDAAVDYINSGMKSQESETFILYNESDDEMIWIDRYHERDGQDLGYTVSRQKDKSVSFDKKTGLSVVEKSEADADLKTMVIEEAGRMKLYNAAAKLAKFDFVKELKKSSYVDFENKVIHCNPDEQLHAQIKTIVDQLRNAAGK